MAGSFSLLLLLLAALLDVGLVVRDLRTAENQARKASVAISSGELGDAADAIEAAIHATRAAKLRLDRGHWRAAERLPGVGDDITALRALAATGAAGADITERLLDAARPIADEGAYAIVADGRLQVQLLVSIADALNAVEMTVFEQAREALHITAQAPLGDRLDEAVTQMLQLSHELASAVPLATDTLSLLIDLLGAHEDRRYLVAVQNPGELRGTGGLIGFLAVLEARDGKLELAKPTGIGTDTMIDGTVLVPLGAFSRLSRFEVEAPADYQDRYGSVGGAEFLPSTNVDPDLPTVAPLVLAQYEQATGQRLDGLLAVDPLGLQLLFQAIGPLDAPDGVAELSEHLPDPIPGEEIAQVLLVDSYEVLGGGSPQRRLYHAEVAGAAVRNVLEAEWEPLGIGRALFAAVTARHIQFYSANPAEQARVERLGVAGALRPHDDGDDLLAVTVVNIGGNKADVHVAHELEHDLRLEVLDTERGRELRRHSTSTYRIVNAVDADSDPYITNSLEPTRVGEPRRWTGEIGLARSWVTLWSPPGFALVEATDLNGAGIVTWRDEIHDLETVDHLLATPRLRTTGIEMTLRGSTGIEVTGDTLTYPLTLWRQAKGIADQLDVTIAAPAGWRIEAVDVASGGPAIGLGPAPFTTPVTLVEHTDRLIRIEGSMTADVRVVLELHPTRPN